MANYTLICESGTVALVAGRSIAEVETEWDRLVAIGDAEDRIDGTTERASRRDVRLCQASGHDYR